MLSIGPIAFASPWLLIALLGLPVLWWLLRVTPPAPRQLRFPAIRFVMGLTSEEKTPAAAPWWLVLLRLLAAALIMVGLAHPLFNPGAAFTGTGPLVMVIDDGWTAADDWAERQQTMLRLIDQAERESRSIVILTTAPAGRGGETEPPTVLRAAEARGLVETLVPKPWPVDRAATARRLGLYQPDASSPVVWASDGLSDPGAQDLAEQLAALGSVTLLRPDRGSTPLIVTPSDATLGEFSVQVRRVEAVGPQDFVVVVRAGDGRSLSRNVGQFGADELETSVVFDLPTEMRNEVAQVVIENQSAASAVALIDERWRRRPVGVIADAGFDSGMALLSETYYVERAFQPVGDVRLGTTDELLRSEQAIVVLPDRVPVTTEELDALADWIAAGGVLVRFAGPRLAASETDTLTPVALRKGGRALGGAMLWTRPARLAPFPENSPFVRLEIPEEVWVVRQVLAEPSLELNEKTWARLEDGTPLVTADKRGEGWVVLIHTSANTDWSNLSLSGLFVQMMDRVVSLSRGVATSASADRALPPFEVLDGFGRLTKPAANVLPLPSDTEEETPIGPTHPPGYYGSELVRQAVNLGPSIGSTSVLSGLPVAINDAPYGESGETDMKPWFLAAALLLFIVDALATLALRGLLPTRWRARQGSVAAGAVAVLCLLPLQDLQAQGRAESFALEATLETRLAFVRTGDSEVDRISYVGLATLTRILDRRTAVEAGEPMAVNIDRDELAFFPLLYWPITQSQEPLSQDTIARLNTYMARGGTILFDTRDAHLRGIGGTRAGDVLRGLARGLDVPAMVTVPPDHVLTKAFYLMQDFPGRWSGSAVWVERPGARTNDGVSRIIVGANDWAAAWAMDESGRPLYPVVPGGERQREMAFRFGINLVMYTLTGNYKADQVHVPAILERLGQ